MNIRVKRSLAMLFFVSWAGAANAVLVDNGLTTIDTETGLEWLDITETVGLSYNAVLGSAFVVNDGYRYASEAEVFELYNNAGGTGTVNVQFLAENTAPAILLLGLMGCTSELVGNPCDGVPEDWSTAMWGASSEFIGLIDDHPSGGVLATRWVSYGNDDASFRQDVGSFLVRASGPPAPNPNLTPVPTLGALSLAMLALFLGLIGFRAVRRV